MVVMMSFIYDGHHHYKRYRPEEFPRHLDFLERMTSQREL